jgi:hypothetical protein
MDALRQSVSFSKLDRKTNEYIWEKLDLPDTILDEITPKQLIWYGHVPSLDPTRLPKIMIKWKPEGRKNDGIYTAMSESDLIMGNGIWKSEGFARCFNQHIYIYVCICISFCFIIE